MAAASALHGLMDRNCMETNTIEHRDMEDTAVSPTVVDSVVAAGAVQALIDMFQRAKDQLM